MFCGWAYFSNTIITVFTDVRIPYEISVWILMKASPNQFCNMMNRIWIFLSKLHTVLKTKCKICQMLPKLFWGALILEFHVSKLYTVIQQNIRPTKVLLKAFLKNEDTWFSSLSKYWCCWVSVLSSKYGMFCFLNPRHRYTHKSTSANVHMLWRGTAPQPVHDLINNSKQPLGRLKFWWHFWVTQTIYAYISFKKVLML